MKKILVLLTASLLSLSNAYAQRVQWVYGSTLLTQPENLGNGILMRDAEDGQLFTGISNVPNNRLQVVKNNPYGYAVPGSPLPGGYFNKVYGVVAANGVNLTIQSAMIEEVNAGTIIVAGNYLNPSTQEKGIYFLQLAGNGSSVVSAKLYSSILPNTSLRLGNIHTETTSGIIYLAGTSVNNSGVSDLLVMKLAMNGVPSWTSVFNITVSGASQNETGTDLTLNTAGTELAVIGNTSATGGISNAFFMMVVANTGAASGQAQLWGASNTVDELYSINRTSGGNYLVCGKTNSTASGDYDMWGMVLTGIGTTSSFSRTYQYNGTINPHNYGNDAAENPNNGELYFTGTTENGVLGLRDMYVIRTDAGGKGMFQGQFTYGGSGNDMGMSVDVSPNNPYPGITMFGTTESYGIVAPSKHLYYVRAGFDGSQTIMCTVDLRDVIYNTAPGFIGSYNVGTTNTTTTSNATGLVIDDGEAYNICNDFLQTKLKGEGLAVQGSKTSQAVIAPNPVEPGTSTLQVSVTAPAGQLEVIIADYMGRQYVNQRFDIRDGGAQTLSVELGRANLSPGVYLLRVNGLDKPATQVLVVK